MKKTDSVYFKPKQSVVVSGILWGFFFLSLPIFLLWLFLSIEMDISVMIFLGIIGLSCLFYAYYSFSIIWHTRLIINSQKIVYKASFITIYCEWLKIKGIAYSDKFFLIRVSETNKSQRNKLIDLFFIGQQGQDIPIHPFVKKWMDQDNWKEDELLKNISAYLPGIEDEIHRQKL
jgi:hypothetical protein